VFLLPIELCLELCLKIHYITFLISVLAMIHEASGSWDGVLYFFSVSFALAGIINIIADVMFPLNVKFQCRKI